MNNKGTEKTLGKILAFGSFIVSVFLLTGMNTDPVNVTKFVALGSIGTSAFLVSVYGFRTKFWLENKAIVVICIIFIFSMLNSLIMSDGPFNQGLYGIYGRNTGLLTYLFLTFIFISALLITEKSIFLKVLFAFFAAGVVNIIYCAWVLSFGDFIGWSNPYGNILGLLGNPDFISAFLGMFIAASLSFIFCAETGLMSRIVLSVASLVALIEIIRSHAIQGLVVTVGSAAIVGFFIVRSRSNGNMWPLVYSLLIGATGLVAILGTFQKGPFSFVYKRSVSFRGSYWKAGIDMGSSHPFSGVGLDSYGDWYRRTRPPVALIDTPGVATVSNVSHNVVIDFFASGGYPLLVSYLAIIVVVIVAVIHGISFSKSYDRIFVALTAVWVGYQVQSIISINQIGLTIWGWVFGGLLISYSRVLQKDSSPLTDPKVNANKKPSPQIWSPGLIAGAGLLIGAFISFPPFNSDSKWFNATQLRSVEAVESSLIPTYLNPADSTKYELAVNLFQASNLPDLAHKYALQAIKYNPDSFIAWKQIYFLPSSTQSEKNRALLNMKRLDPKNKEVTAP